MGRKRREADKWMPERVYRGRSAFELRPREGGCIRLCPLDANREEVWAAYGKAKAASASRSPGALLFGELMDRYLGSEQFRDRKPATQAGYLQCAEKLRPVFGEAEPEAITAYILRQYMDRRGKQSRTRANRERSFMGVVWAWAYERNLVKVRSPVPNVRPWKESPRERYVTDPEYLAVYKIAPASVRVAMEIAYLCAARQADVLSLRWGRTGQAEPDARQNAVVLEHGIYIRQGKTGKRQIKLWTPRLRKAVHRAKSNQGKVASLHVVHNKSGQRYTRSGFETMFARARNKALADGSLVDSYTFHDLKAKGVSDYEGDKQKFSGHATRAQMERYNRKPEIVSALDKKEGQ